MHPAELTECDDMVLLSRSRGGDVDAFGELVRRHQVSALRLAAVIGGSTEEAKDIVQDAFVSVHASLASYRGSGSVRSWMLRVVANHAKNHVRSQARRRHRDDVHARLNTRPLEGADAVAERQLEREALIDAMRRLSRDDRQVLGSRFIAGLSEAETADVLGVAVGTVKSRTSRALGRLQHEFDISEASEVGR
jgi:RNA polymerase sigma factor (sigma-70 family)